MTSHKFGTFSSPSPYHAPVSYVLVSQVNYPLHVLDVFNECSLARCKVFALIFQAFQIGMFGLELARPPASTKPMEVKLAHQESELVGLLKRIPLGESSI